MVSLGAISSSATPAGSQRDDKRGWRKGPSCVTVLRCFMPAGIRSPSKQQDVVNVDMEVDENVRALPGKGVLVVSAQENPTAVGLNCRDGKEVGAHVGVLDAPRKRLIFKRRPRTDVEKVSSEQAVEVNKKRQMSGPEGDVQEGRKRSRES